MQSLHEIRMPIKTSRSRKLLSSMLVCMGGIALGLISKMLDTTANNALPYFLEILDLRNFFSRIGIWLFLAAAIAVYNTSPIQAAIDVVLFFVGMVGSYYGYTIVVAGFFPASYMMIWVVMTCISPCLAFVCWYAKGKGNIAIGISSIILMIITRQTFAFGFWYFDLRNILEFLVWIATILMLYQSTHQVLKVLFIGLLLFFLTAQISFLGGMI